MLQCLMAGRLYVVRENFTASDKGATEIPSQVSKQLSVTLNDTLTASLCPINSRYVIGDEAANSQL
jgi:hypothetical protein